MNSPFNAPLVPGYGFARVRDSAFDAVRALWKKRRGQGVTQIDLANRIGRDPAWVSKKLSGPGNWTLRTFGELVDGLDGEVSITIDDMLEKKATNNYDAYACLSLNESANDNNQSAKGGGSANSFSL